MKITDLKANQVVHCKTHEGELLSDYTFIDGSPCGKEVEE